jgi:hypothetical protein
MAESNKAAGQKHTNKPGQSQPDNGKRSAGPMQEDGKGRTRLPTDDGDDDKAKPKTTGDHDGGKQKPAHNR